MSPFAQAMMDSSWLATELAVYGSSALVLVLGGVCLVAGIMTIRWRERLTFDVTLDLVPPYGTAPLTVELHCRCTLPEASLQLTLHEPQGVSRPLNAALTALELTCAGSYRLTATALVGRTSFDVPLENDEIVVGQPVTDATASDVEQSLKEALSTGCAHGHRVSELFRVSKIASFKCYASAVIAEVVNSQAGREERIALKIYRASDSSPSAGYSLAAELANHQQLGRFFLPDCSFQPDALPIGPDRFVAVARMPWFNGVSLDSALRQILLRPRSAGQRAGQLLAELTDLFSMLQSHGITHGDLCPQNLLVPENGVLHLVLVDYDTLSRAEPTPRLKSTAGREEYVHPIRFRHAERLDDKAWRNVDVFSQYVIYLSVLAECLTPDTGVKKSGFGISGFWLNDGRASHPGASRAEKFRRFLQSPTAADLKPLAEMFEYFEANALAMAEYPRELAPLTSRFSNELSLIQSQVAATLSARLFPT